MFDHDRYVGPGSNARRTTIYHDHKRQEIYRNANSHRTGNEKKQKFKHETIHVDSMQQL